GESAPQSDREARVNDEEPASRPAAFGLVGLAGGVGVIGMAVGFATLLGITATAAGGTDTSGYGAMALTAASSFLLGALLIVGSALVWRAHRSARVVTVAAVTSVLLLCALAAMLRLLRRDGVRDHVRAGDPLRLR